jgi:hypothetical protein
MTAVHDILSNELIREIIAIRISTCVAIGLVDPPMFYAHCKAQHNLSTR